MNKALLPDIGQLPEVESHISKTKLPKVPWFNDVCKQAIKERKKAQRKLFRNPTAENVLAFKQLKAKARHIIKTQKKASWQSFCSSLTSKTKPKTVWKAIRKIKGEKSTSSLGHLKVNGKIITDKKQIANLLVSTISNNSSSQLYSPKFQAIKKQNGKKLCEIHPRQHRRLRPTLLTFRT